MSNLILTNFNIFSLGFKGDPGDKGELNNFFKSIPRTEPHI